MYEIRYLETAIQDIVEIVSYIAFDLSEPQAADKLAEDLLYAGNAVKDFPYSRPVYFPVKPLEHEYRRILVKNYVLFYWIDEENKNVIIDRVIYSGRNISEVIKDNKQK